MSEFTTNYKQSIRLDLMECVKANCEALGHCVNLENAKVTVKKDIQGILCDEGIEGDTVSLIDSNGVMCKAWLVDLFANERQSSVCNLVVLTGTSAVNCGISSEANLTSHFLQRLSKECG